MRIALLDQSFHKRTRSTRFLVDWLRPLGPVSHFFVDEDNLATVSDDNDLIILIQTEFCAPYFLARGKRTLIVPMYDACANMPDGYWHAMTGARVISFCRKLHMRVLKNGLDSIYVQYFPDTANTPIVQDFSNLRGFLWQRRPREGVNWRLVSRLCSLDSLHVHLAADDGNNGLEVLPFGTTTSIWGPDSSDYMEHLRAANVFFAPRRAEGIGLANLEAMAHGMCVVSHDDATANEYVKHQQNGYLYNITEANNLVLTTARARQCGQEAREAIERGYKQLNARIEDLLYFVSSTPKPSPLYASHFPPKEFIRSARILFKDAPGMQGLLTKVEGHGAFSSLDRWKRIVRLTPILGSVAEGIYRWSRGC